MNKLEVSEFLTVVSVLDSRKVNPETVEVWHDLIGNLDYEDAIAAAAMHRQESVAWLEPHHIIANVKRIRSERSTNRGIDRSHEERLPSPKNLDAWSAAWDSPREFSRQEAIYHQQLRDQGFDPHKIRLGMRSDWQCYSCLESPLDNVDPYTGVVD